MSEEKQAPTMVYSANEDSGFSEDFSSTVDTLLCNNDRLSAGLVYYVGEKVEHTPATLAHGSAEDVIERMQSKAWDAADEFSDGYGDNVTKEAKQELERLIGEWADKHMRVDFFTVTKIHEAALTAEEAAEYDPPTTPKEPA